MFFIVFVLFYGEGLVFGGVLVWLLLVVVWCLILPDGRISISIVELFWGSGISKHMFPFALTAISGSEVEGILEMCARNWCAWWRDSELVLSAP